MSIIRHNYWGQNLHSLCLERGAPFPAVSFLKMSAFSVPLMQKRLEGWQRICLFALIYSLNDLCSPSLAFL